MSSAPFPITPEMTAISLAYKNTKLIADDALPRVPVGTQEFKYPSYTKADQFTVPDTKVGRKSAPNEVEFTATEVTTKADDYGLDDPVPLEEYHKIAEAMRTMKGSAILTINDHPEMKKIFKEFRMETVEINYTIGGAGKGQNRRELIFKNW